MLKTRWKRNPSRNRSFQFDKLPHIDKLILTCGGCLLVFPDMITLANHVKYFSQKCDLLTAKELRNCACHECKSPFTSVTDAVVHIQRCVGKNEKKISEIVGEEAELEKRLSEKSKAIQQFKSLLRAEYDNISHQENYHGSEVLKMLKNLAKQKNSIIDPIDKNEIPENLDTKLDRYKLAIQSGELYRGVDMLSLLKSLVDGPTIEIKPVVATSTTEADTDVDIDSFSEGQSRNSSSRTGKGKYGDTNCRLCATAMKRHNLAVAKVCDHCRRIYQSLQGLKYNRCYDIQEEQTCLERVNDGKSKKVCNFCCIDYCSSHGLEHLGSTKKCGVCRVSILDHDNREFNVNACKDCIGIFKSRDYFRLQPECKLKNPKKNKLQNGQISYVYVLKARFLNSAEKIFTKIFYHIWLIARF